MKKLIILYEIIIIILLLMASGPVAETQEQKYFILKVTGYCPCEICCGEWANGKTFTGDPAGRGCVAIDPINGPLKMGQKLFIEGYGFGVANDIGQAIKGWEADACFDTHKEAQEWGVKLVKVYLIEKGKDDNQ